MISKEVLERLIAEGVQKIQSAVDVANKTNGEVQAYRKLLAEFEVKDVGDGCEE